MNLASKQRIDLDKSTLFKKRIQRTALLRGPTLIYAAKFRLSRALISETVGYL